MNKQKAIDLFEALVLNAMKSGAFQDFKSLDEYRDAIAELRKEDTPGDAIPLHPAQ